MTRFRRRLGWLFARTDSSNNWRPINWSVRPTECLKCGTNFYDLVASLNTGHATVKWHKGKTAILSQNPVAPPVYTEEPSLDTMGYTCVTCGYSWRTTCRDDPVGAAWDEWNNTQAEAVSEEQGTCEG